MEQTQTLRRRDTDTAWMRLIAAFFVVLIHVAKPDTLAGLCLNALSRFAVPVFVMISGYYLLNRPMSGRKIAQRVGKYFGIMVIWSALYLAHELSLKSFSVSDAGDVIRYLLTQPVHLWYFYGLIGLYLFTPVLQVFHVHASQQVYRYALALCFTLGSLVLMGIRSEVWPTLAVIVDKMKIPYVLGFLFLYLFGGYVRRFGLRSPLGLSAVGAIAAVLGTVGAVLLRKGAQADLLLSFFAPNNLLAGMGFFALFKHLSPRMSSPGAKPVRALAAGTLGIYVLHPLFLMVWGDWLAKTFDGLGFFAYPAKALVLYLAAMGVTGVLLHIPVVRRIVC